MQIGEPERAVLVEPLEDPIPVVPSDEPEEAVDEPTLVPA
jgi:hypothetical protein